MKADILNTRLKQARLELSISQKEMSTKLGVKQSFYSDIENGRRSVSKKFIEKFTKTFPVSKNWIYTGEGNIFTPEKGNKNYPENVPALYPDNVKLQDYYLPERDHLLLQAGARLGKELEKESPKLYSLLADADQLKMFSNVLGHLNKRDLTDLLNPKSEWKSYLVDGLFNYAKYKQIQIDRLRQFEHLGPALDRLRKAIIRFYKDFSEFENYKIWKEHLPGLPDLNNESR